MSAARKSSMEKARKIIEGVWASMNPTLSSAENEDVAERLLVQALDAAVKEEREEALEEAAKSLCQYCSAGWEVEVREYGAYHKIPPKNLPTVWENVKCGAFPILSLKCQESARSGEGV